MRSIFGFLFATGRIQHDLARCVPRVAKLRSGTLMRHLQTEDIRRLVDAVGNDDGIGRRDHAMLLLMARLGLRAQEVIAIRLEDIDWRAGEILIRGKGGQHERMPLPVDVGEAIAANLQDGVPAASVTSSLPPRRLTGRSPRPWPSGGYSERLLRERA